ncbi:hypothetical protein E2C01_074259 [Portunus trituberculatus]|uniref:Uncharacterized protein n=1 Tax=Portunus trituberculatus TaxID=210409 RepID=A0A5B7IDU9_PORTR|nr:hypothetical protein [Portunus trituberculatus]
MHFLPSRHARNLSHWWRRLSNAGGGPRFQDWSIKVCFQEGNYGGPGYEVASCGTATRSPHHHHAWKKTQELAQRQGAI